MIQFKATVGYVPKANKIAEWCNWLIPKKANAMHFEAGLLGSYWVLACICITYFNNWSSSREKNIILWKTWYNKWFGTKHYKIFGCPAYIQLPKKKRNKLANKKWKGIFVGYHENTDRIWKFWDPVDKKIREIKSVIFVKTFSIKSSEELLNSFTDFNQESDTSEISTDTDPDSDKLKPMPAKKQPPISNLTSPLSSLRSSFLRLILLLLPQLPQSALIKSNRQ